MTMQKRSCDLRTGQITVTQLSEQEIAARVPYVPTREEQQQYRASAYVAEADPLFFKSQRGEATTAEWEAKVAEIKARYPYPDEA